MATASQSLFNMTVASDNAGGNQGLLMPKLQFRFRVNFLNFGVDVNGGLQLTKQVVDCSRPNLSFAEIPLQVYNSTLKIAGKHTRADMSVNIRDDASGSVSRAVGQQLQKQFDFVEQASAATGQDYKFQTNIEILDGGNGALAPTVLETWTGLSLDPNSSNYVARVIGDINENYDSVNNQIQYSGSFSNKSNYVRVSAVNFTTPNYFDANGLAKSQFTGSLPTNASGTFGGAIGVAGGAVAGTALDALKLYFP